MSKPSDKFKEGGWVRVMPAAPTDKQLLRLPRPKRTARDGTIIMYEYFAGGIYQVTEVCNGDFTVALNIDGRARWFDPDWLITVEDPDRLKEQDIRFKEGMRQIEAADKRRDEIFKHMLTPWWAKEKK